MTTHNLNETYELAKRFIENLTSSETQRSGACVVLLRGELGSGKTSFAQGIARALGVTEHVTSPTFVIEKVYVLPPGGSFERLIHIDAYRLTPEEPLDLEAIWDDSRNLVVIEWPERLGGTIARATGAVDFTFVDENTRLIQSPLFDTGSHGVE